MDSEIERCEFEMEECRRYIDNGGNDFMGLMGLGDWFVEMELIKRADDAAKLSRAKR